MVVVLEDLVDARALLLGRATTRRAGAMFAARAIGVVAARAFVVRFTTRRFPIGDIDAEFAMADVFLFDFVEFLF
jgi:hypothetical protein